MAMAEVTATQARYGFCVDLHLGRRGCGATTPKWSEGYGVWICGACYMARTLWVEAKVCPGHPLSDDEIGQHWRRLRGWSAMGTARVPNRVQEDGWVPCTARCRGCGSPYRQGRRAWVLCLACTLKAEPREHRAPSNEDGHTTPSSARQRGAA